MNPDANRVLHACLGNYTFGKTMACNSRNAYVSQILHFYAFLNEANRRCPQFTKKRKKCGDALKYAKRQLPQQIVSFEISRCVTLCILFLYLDEFFQKIP